MKTGVNFYFSWGSLISGLLVSVAWVFGFWSLYNIVTDFSNQWYWFVLAVLYGVVPLDQFIHNVVIHNSMKMNPRRWMSRILLFIAVTQMSLGRVKTFLILHNVHHAYSDQPGRDPLYFEKLSHSLLIQTVNPLTYFFTPKFEIPNMAEFSKKKYLKHKEFMDDPWVNFCNEYYIPMTIVYWTVLFLVFPLFLFNVVFVGRVFASLGNIPMLHLKLPGSYQRFTNGDHSYNNLVFHYLLLGVSSATLHNNHHRLDIRNGHSTRWYEFDTGYYIVKYLLKPLIS